jgi:hypothetical protein
LGKVGCKERIAELIQKNRRDRIRRAAALEKKLANGSVKEGDDAGDILDTSIRELLLQSGGSTDPISSVLLDQLGDGISR